jgi:hypothetical protein
MSKHGKKTAEEIEQELEQGAQQEQTDTEGEFKTDANTDDAGAQDNTGDTSDENKQETSGDSSDGAPAPEGTPSTAEVVTEYELADGTKTASKSAFIRDCFVVKGMSRAQITEKFDFSYRTVYGATVNMDNGSESTRGRSASSTTITVTEAGVNVHVDGDTGVVYFNNVAQPEGTEMPETVEVNRNDWIKEQVAAGVARADVAKALDLSYGVIYGLTKEEAEGESRTKYTVKLEDGTEIPRSEYIRAQVAAGVDKSTLAKQLGVEYGVIWQATKQLKTTAEKFQGAVKVLEKYEDKVLDAAAFKTLIAELNAVEFKVEETPKEDTPETAEATETPAETAGATE